MGNVVAGLNNDGQNSQLFLGNYHNVGSTVSNFTSKDVKFSGTGQNIGFNGTDQTVTFESGVKVVYNTQPTFVNGVKFNDSNNITVGGTQLFQNGLLNPILIPSDLPVKTISDFTNLSATGTISSNNLVTTGYSQAANSLYVGTGAKGYEDAPFRVDNNGDLTSSGRLSASSVSAINLSGRLTGDLVGNVTGNVTGNVEGDIRSNNVSADSVSANSITGKVLYGNVVGNLKGNIEGDIKGGNISGTTVSASSGFYTSASGSATNGPTGGLQISGKNNWVISENSTGNLCFYNTTSTLENATTTPFFCISATGYLEKGIA